VIGKSIVGIIKLLDLYRKTSHYLCAFFNTFMIIFGARALVENYII